MSKTATAAAAPFAPEASDPPPIIMRSISSLKLASEAPKGANLVIRDSSSGSPLTDAELKASIYAKGIIQPLIWITYEGKDYVVAGNRRLRFLREIFADAPTSMVQTQNVADFGGDWREVALDTNLSLPPHLVERYEMIVKIAADRKLQPEDVQARFGMTPRQYNQIMALGKMSPMIRQKWRDGEIDAKTAQAFTLETDPKEQDKIYHLLLKSWPNKATAEGVIRKVVPATQREAGKLVAFVGVDTAKKAKLIKQEDLFATNHVVTDIKALQKLANAKVETVCVDLVQAGWSWAIDATKIQSRYSYGSIEPAAKDAKATPEETARHQELTQLINDADSDGDQGEIWMEEQTRIEQAVKARGFTPAQRAKAGCFIEIGRDGTLVVEYGKVKPEERKSVAATERVERKKAKPKKPGQVTLTNALAERLSAQLEKAIAASLHATPHVAVAALIAGFASNGHVIDVDIGTSQSTPKYGGPNSVTSADEKHFAQVFDGAMKSTPEARVVMLTGIAVRALSIQVSSAETKAPIDRASLQQLVAKMDGKFLNNAIAAEFDAKDYFAGVSLQACVDAVRAACGAGAAAEVAKMKKVAAAKFAADHVGKEGWLPRELRTTHYKGPVEKAAPAKPAKKAPAKKPAAKKTAKKKSKK